MKSETNKKKKEKMFCTNKDINYKILEKLNLKDLQNISCLDRESKKLLDNETFWRNLTIHKYRIVFKEELHTYFNLFRDSFYLENSPWKYFYMYLENVRIRNIYSLINSNRYKVAVKLTEYLEARYEYYKGKMFNQHSSDLNFSALESKEKCMKILREISNETTIDPRNLLRYIFNNLQSDSSKDIFDQLLIIMIKDGYISFEVNCSLARAIITYICEECENKKDFIDQISYLFSNIDIATTFFEYIFDFNETYLLRKISEHMNYGQLLNILYEKINTNYYHDWEINPDVVLDICLEKGASVEELSNHKLAKFKEVEKYLIYKRYPDLHRMIRVMQTKTLSESDYEALSNILSKYF